MNSLLVLKQYLTTKYRRNFSSKRSLQQYQDRQIGQHIEYVLKHSPFYKSLYKDYQKDIAEKKWSNLPTINKQIMMDNFDELNTVNLTKEEAFEVAIKAEETRDFSPTINNVTIGLSSGTSGNRGIFLVSEEEQYLWAGSILAKALPSSILKKHTIAFFLRANSNLYEATKNQRISFHFFDLLDEDIHHIQHLNNIKPSLIVAPPSMLRKIAEWQYNKLLSIQPTKIISVAEVLENIDKKFIESCFNQFVHQIYQCTEGFLASTCKHGTLHINEDLVYIEKDYLDKEKGIFSPIITDFSRKTQPIIRYRLNDILVEKASTCSCGSPFLALERIDGRCDDIFIGLEKETDNSIQIFPDFIRRAIMLASKEITEFKVIQHENLKVEVKIKVKKQDSEKIYPLVEQEFLKLWELKNCKPPVLFFSIYDLKQSDKKLKRIEKIN